jgi:hypothetical protein
VCFFLTSFSVKNGLSGFSAIVRGKRLSNRMDVSICWAVSVRCPIRPVWPIRGVVWHHWFVSEGLSSTVVLPILALVFHVRKSKTCVHSFQPALALKVGVPYVADTLSARTQDRMLWVYVYSGPALVQAAPSCSLKER